MSTSENNKTTNWKITLMFVVQLVTFAMMGVIYHHQGKHTQTNSLRCCRCPTVHCYLSSILMNPCIPSPILFLYTDSRIQNLEMENNLLQNSGFRHRKLEDALKEAPGIKNLVLDLNNQVGDLNDAVFADGRTGLVADVDKLLSCTKC